MHIQSTATIAARQADAPADLKKLVGTLVEADTRTIFQFASEFADDWNRPRVDLYVWVPVLNKFDDVYQQIATKYHIEVPDTCAVLSQEDALRVQSQLELSRQLIEHGSNRGIYDSVSLVSCFLRVENAGVVASALNLLSKLLSLRYAYVKEANRPKPLRQLPKDILSEYITPGKPLDELPSSDPVEYVDENGVTGVFNPRDPEAFDIVDRITGSQKWSLLATLRAANAMDDQQKSDIVSLQVRACVVGILLNHNTNHSALPPIVALLGSKNEKTKNLGYDAVRDVCDYLHKGVLNIRSVLGGMNTMTMLPHVVEQMRNNSLENQETVVLMMRLLLHIKDTNSGLVPLLLDFIRDGSKQRYLRVQCFAMMLLFGLLMDSPASVPALLQCDGLVVITKTLAREVDPTFLESLHESPPALVKVDYLLSYRRVQWIKSLLCTVANVLKHKRSPLVLTQLLNSPILDTCTFVITRPKLFGWLNLSLALQTLSVLLETDSTSVSIMTERTIDGASLMDAVLTSLVPLCELNHNYFSPVLKFIGALSNAEYELSGDSFKGMLEEIFSLLANSDLADYGTLHQVGQGIEAIFADLKEYHPFIVELIISFISSVRRRLDSEYATNPVFGTEGSDDYEPPKSSIVVQNVLFMLQNVFNNHMIMIEFVKQHGLGPLLDLVCHPALPYDFVLSKEITRPDHSFSFILRGLFTIEHDTDYVLNTIISRLDADVEFCSTASFGSRLAESPADHEEILRRLRSFNMLMEGLRAMVFVYIGSGYRVVTALRALAKYDNLIKSLGELQKSLIYQTTWFYKYISEDMNTATLTIYSLAVGLSDYTVPSDHLKAVSEAEKKVMGDPRFHALKAARYTISISQKYIKWFCCEIGLQCSGDNVLKQAKAEGLKLSDEIACQAVDLLNWNFLSSLTEPPNEDTVFVLTALYHVAEYVSHVLFVSLSVLVMFKQRRGITSLFDLLLKSCHPHLMDTPKIVLKLTLKGGHSNFLSEGQATMLRLISSLVDENEILNRTPQSSDQIMRGKGPESFDLEQFYIQLRIIVFSEILRLIPHLSGITPRAWHLLPNLFTAFSEDFSSWKDTEEPAENLPKRLIWLEALTHDARVQTLVRIGVNSEDAQRALEATEDDLCQATENLTKSSYPGLSLPGPSPIFDNEMPIINGERVVKISAFAEVKRDKTLKYIIPSFVDTARNHPEHAYYAADIIIKLFESMSAFAIKGCCQRIFGELGPTECRLLAVMLKSKLVFNNIFPELIDKLPILWDHVENFQEDVSPCIFIIEQILSKCHAESTDFGTLSLFRISYPNADFVHGLKFVKLMAEKLDICPENAELIVNASRLTLLLCSREHALCETLINSGLLLKFMSAVRVLEGDAYGKRVEICTLMLLPVIVESEARIEKIIRKQFSRWASKPPSYENITNILRKGNGMLVRSPRLFFKVLRGSAVLPNKNSYSFLWTQCVKAYAAEVCELLGEPNVGDFPIELGEEPDDNELAENLQIPIVKHVLDAILEINYEEKYEAIANAHKAYQQAKKLKDHGLAYDESAHDVYSKLANDFKSDSYFLKFLLEALIAFVKSTDSAKYYVLNYPSTNTTQLPKGRSKFLQYLLCDLLTCEDSDDAILHNRLADSISTSSVNLICSLINISTHSRCTSESLALYVGRGKYVVDAIVQILTREFVNVKSSVFAQNPRLSWCLNFLHQSIHLFRELLKTVDSSWAECSDRPVMPKIMVDKKIPALLNICLAKLNLSDPRLDSLRLCAIEIFTSLAKYDSANYDYKELPRDTFTIDEIFDEDDDEDDELGFEVEFSDEDPTGLEYDNAIHQRQLNLFRHSSLGMFEGGDEEDTDDGRSLEEEAPQGYEYDHLSDDEVLSDIGQEEDEDDQIEVDDFYDLTDEGLDDESIDDADGTSDVFSDEMDENEHANRVLNFFDELMLTDDDSGFDGLAPERRSEGLSDSEFPDEDTGFLGSDSENGLEPSLFEDRFKYLERSVEAKDANMYVTAPLWLSPRAVAAEDYYAMGKMEPERKYDGHEVFIPNIDLGFHSRLGYYHKFLNQLCTNFEFRWGQFSHIFFDPESYNTETIIEFTKAALSSPDCLSWIEKVQELYKKKSQSENPRVEPDHASDSESWVSTDSEVEGPVPSNIIVEEREILDENTEDEDRETREPILITVGGREVDIAGLGMDPLFLEALPEDIREEVLENQMRQVDEPSSPEIAEENPFVTLMESVFRRRVENTDDNAHPESGLYKDIDTTLDYASRDHWAFIPSKNHTGIYEWTPPLFDSYSLASLLRQFYLPISTEQSNDLLPLLDLLAENRKLRDEIVFNLVMIIRDVSLDNASLQLGFHAMTAKAVNNPVVSKQSTNAPHYPMPDSVLAPNTLQCVIALINIARTHNINELFLTPQVWPHSNKKKALLNSLIELFDRPVILEDSNLMGRLTFLIFDITSSLSAPKEDNNAGNAIDNSDEDEEGNEDITANETEEDMNYEVSTIIPSTEQDSPSPPEVVPENSFQIPDSNIDRLVSVLTANECSAATFLNMLEIISNCSGLPNFLDSVKNKLLKYARRYRQRVLAQMKSLHSFDAMTLNKSALSDFTGGSADQTKFLRLVTVMDHLHKSKNSSGDQKLISHTELMDMFKQLNIYPIWIELGKCLDIIEADNPNFATALLPLIESLTVVSKRVQRKRSSSYANWLKSMLGEFTNKHRAVLNYLVRANPKLLSGSFSILAKDSRILDFDNKQKFFNRRAMEEKQSLVPQHLRLKVRRDQVFLDTYRSLFFKDPNEIKRADIQVTFHSEEGVDAGGLTREWYSTLSKQIFNPDYALFIPESTDSTIFQPNPSSWVNPEHLSFFKFVGRIIGKAVFDGRVMDCYFSRVVYKRILRKTVTLEDMEAVDENYYKSLKWMLENDITDVLEETFSVESDEFGQQKVVELKPNGRNIPVTDENKHEYVKLLVEYKLVKSVEAQMEQLVKGFTDVVPEKLKPFFNDLFDERELELLICGLPDIDIDDWRNNTLYQNYTVNSPQIKWFWRAVSSFNNEERAKLLQFATGTSKVPVGGFARLESSRGIGKFCILRDSGSSNRWPSAHTCTNQMNLPVYDDYDQLRSALLKAITVGSSGFGFA